MTGIGQQMIFSIRDESLHSEAGCKLYRTLIEENPELNTAKLQQDIIDGFSLALEKAKYLKSAFKGFLSSLKITVSTFMDTVAYSFLIPIIMDIQYIASNSSNPKESAILIAERLIASGGALITAQVLSQVIKKIIEKIK